MANDQAQALLSLVTVKHFTLGNEYEESCSAAALEFMFVCVCVCVCVNKDANEETCIIMSDIAVGFGFGQI